MNEAGVAEVSQLQTLNVPPGLNLRGSAPEFAIDGINRKMPLINQSSPNQSDNFRQGIDVAQKY